VFVIGSIRTSFESLLKADEAPVRNGLLTSFRSEFPAWTRSLRVVLERFEDWLSASLARAMAELSRKHREELVEPVEHISRQLAQCLQDFRKRLSERALETLGVPLKTTEVDFRPEAPRTPVVRFASAARASLAIVRVTLRLALARIDMTTREAMAGACSAHRPLSARFQARQHPPAGSADGLEDLIP
jgi:hypothetical protein